MKSRKRSTKASKTLEDKGTPPYRKSTRKAEVKVIVRLDSKINCKFCDFTTDTELKYRSHLFSVHCEDLVPNTPSPTPPPDAQSKYACNCCSKKFTKTEQLNSHFLEYHRFKLISERRAVTTKTAILFNEFAVIQPDLEDSEYNCCVCPDKKYSNKANLKRHLNSHHRIVLPIGPLPVIPRDEYRPAPKKRPSIFEHQLTPVLILH